MLDDGRDDGRTTAPSSPRTSPVTRRPSPLLVRRHRDRLWAVALRTLRDREEAADALQDALLSAFRNADGYRGDAAVTTWLHRVVVNACLDRMRRRAVRPSVPLGEHRRARTGATTSAPRRPPRRRAPRSPGSPRRSAPPSSWSTCRTCPVAEAAAVLGVAEGTVKSRCSRGRLALARIFRGRGAGRARRRPAGTCPSPRASHQGSPPAAGTRRRRRAQAITGRGRRAWPCLDGILTTTCSPTSPPTSCPSTRPAPSRRTSWPATAAPRCCPTPSTSGACCSPTTPARPARDLEPHRGGRSPPAGAPARPRGTAVDRRRSPAVRSTSRRPRPGGWDGPDPLDDPDDWATPAQAGPSGAHRRSRRRPGGVRASRPRAVTPGPTGGGARRRCSSRRGLPRRPPARGRGRAARPVRRRDASAAARRERHPTGAAPSPQPGRPPETPRGSLIPRSNADYTSSTPQRPGPRAGPGGTTRAPPPRRRRTSSAATASAVPSDRSRARAPAVAADPQATDVTNPARLAACRRRRSAASRTAVVAVDLARYQGREAAVLVRPHGGGYEVWVVERTCHPGDEGALGRDDARPPGPDRRRAREHRRPTIGSTSPDAGHRCPQARGELEEKAP